jgi:hypothetical protein
MRPIQREPETLSTGVKRPKREADHSHVYNAVVMNEWRYTSTPSTYHHEGPEDNFTFFPGIYLKGQKQLVLWPTLELSTLQHKSKGLSV